MSAIATAGELALGGITGSPRGHCGLTSLAIVNAVSKMNFLTSFSHFL